MSTALLTRTDQLSGKAAQLTDLLTEKLIRRPVPTAQDDECLPYGERCLNDYDCCSGTCDFPFATGRGTCH
jgi:hypothetical protein